MARYTAAVLVIATLGFVWKGVKGEKTNPELGKRTAMSVPADERVELISTGEEVDLDAYLVAEKGRYTVLEFTAEW